MRVGIIDIKLFLFIKYVAMIMAGTNGNEFVQSWDFKSTLFFLYKFKQ